MSLSFALILAAPGLALAQAGSPLATDGKGVLKEFSPVTGETLDVEVRLRNTTNQPVKVTRAEVLLACQGGWSIAQGDSIARERKFFGGDPVLTAGGNWVYRVGYNYSIPITHYLLAAHLSTPGGPGYDHLLEIPVVRPGYESPPALHATAPVFIGLQEPVEVLELATGEVWLPIIGQIINVSGTPLTLRRWHVQLQTAAETVEIDRDLTATLPIRQSTATLNEFLYGFPVPRAFQKGMLHIRAELDVGSKQETLTRDAPVERVAGITVAAPVSGVWTWGNGAGETVFHTHFHAPEQRYAYDIGIFKNVNGQRQTFAGEPNRNESFFNWNQPIYCVQDGKVVVVVDDVPDNFGRTPNPANNPVRNSCILVEHAGAAFSAYVHVRQGSAEVKVGQNVKAGDILGRLGNAGASSEPHLHFQYQVLDQTGRTRTVPVRIAGLRFPDGRPAVGIPKGAVEYLSEARAGAKQPVR